MLTNKCSVLPIISLFFCLLSITLVKAHPVQSPDSINSADKRGIIEYYLKKSWQIRSSQQEESLQLNYKALMSAKATHQQDLYMEGLFRRSVLFLKQDQYDSAIDYANECIAAGNQFNNAQYTGMGYNQLGTIYSKQGDYQSELKYYLNALEIFKSANFNRGIAASQLKIGTYYLKENQYEEAISNYINALERFENELNTNPSVSIYNQISGTLNNLGKAYASSGKQDKAITYYQKALNFSIDYSLQDRLAWVELNLGEIYFKMKHYSAADSFLNLALKHAISLKISYVQARSLTYLGELNIATNNFSKGISKLHESLDFSKAHELKNLELDIYMKFAELYESIQNYDSSYAYLKKYLQLNDSLNDQNKAKQTTILREKYQVAKKNEELKFRRARAEVYELRQWASFVIVILLILLMVLLYFYYRSKQNSLKADLRHKEQLNQQKVSELLKDQEISNIRSKMEGQELERKRIAQEIHDGIGGSLAGIKLNLIRFNKSCNQNEEELSAVIEKMDIVCEEVRAVAHDLIPPSFTDNSLIDLVEEFIPRNSRDGKTTFYYELYPKNEINALPVKFQVELFRIIQELIVNIRKHAKASEVNLSLILHDRYVNLMVEDDGQGFDISQKNEGLGLKNIHSRIDVYGGQLTIDSQQGRGTSVNIDIPLPPSN